MWKPGSWFLEARLVFTHSSTGVWKPTTWFIHKWNIGRKWVKDFFRICDQIPWETADLVTFTEKILNGKFLFFAQWLRFSIFCFFLLVCVFFSYFIIIFLLFTSGRNGQLQRSCMLMKRLIWGSLLNATLQKKITGTKNELHFMVRNVSDKTK